MSFDDSDDDTPLARSNGHGESEPGNLPSRRLRCVRHSGTATIKTCPLRPVASLAALRRPRVHNSHRVCISS